MRGHSKKLFNDRKISKFKLLQFSTQKYYTCFRFSGPAWFPASTPPRSFEATGRQGSDPLSPGKISEISQTSQSLFGKPVKRSLRAVFLLC